MIVTDGFDLFSTNNDVKVTASVSSDPLTGVSGAKLNTSDILYDHSDTDIFDPFENKTLKDPLNGTQVYPVYNASELTSLMQVNTTIVPY